MGDKKKHGCFINLLSFICLIGLMVWGAKSCDKFFNSPAVQPAVQALTDSNSPTVEEQNDTSLKEINKTVYKEFRLSDGIIYHGKKRSPIWFNYFYDQFKDKIAYQNGQYIEVSPQIYTCKVLQVINNNEALMSMRGYERCHVIWPNKLLIDDQSFQFRGIRVSNGRYSYTTVLGAPSTVASFTIIECKTLTKEEFADAINNGFELPANVQ